MAIDFAGSDVDPSEFGKPEEVPVLSVKTEPVQVRVETGNSVQRDARQADSKWVFCMSTIAVLPSEMGVLALSDGVTNHMVNSLRVEKSEDDYLLIYDEPWETQRGSFLEAGKNVGGCAAERRSDGSWAIPARQLWRVLDSVHFRTPKVEGEGNDDPEHHASVP
jgi:hypothetical protein